MKKIVIRTFNCKGDKFLLYLQMLEDGAVRFIANRPKRRQVEYVDLSTTATDDVRAEISSKSIKNSRYGLALFTESLSNATKEFINLCWNELKEKKPHFGIK